MNPVRLLLLLIAGAALALSGFVAVAPNRLVSGHPLMLARAAGPLAVLVVVGLGALLLGTGLRRGRAGEIVAAGAAAGLLLALFYGAAQAADRLSDAAGPIARVSLGPAFWIAALAAALLLVDAVQRLALGPLARLLIAAAVAALVLAGLAAGFFDALSILREYAQRRAVFRAEFARHCLLVIGALLPALLIGVPLGIAAARRARLRGPLFATLNLLQTIPSVALFGLLILPLSALAAMLPGLARLGIGGIGFAPALIALTLYALLPIVRNTEAGLAGIDPAVIEAARGMGLTRRQIFRQVEVPLGLPVFLAGIRIVLVQAIGLAVVAALIGAGGLGTFVFQGIGQYAIDLVLLGAVPTILLALAVNFLLGLIVQALSREGTAP